MVASSADIADARKDFETPSLDHRSASTTATVKHSCLACSHRNLHKVRRYRTISRAGAEVFGGARLYECFSCGLVQLAPPPPPKALADYYAIDYRRSKSWYGSDVADPAKFPKDNLFYYNRGQSVAQLLAPHIRMEKPWILDVGAGFGHILHALGQRFPESSRTAIECSAICVRHLQSLGVKVLSHDIENGWWDEEKRFDVIVLSHVLEHLPNPCAVLRLLYRSLSSDGILYVEVPHIPSECLVKYLDHVWAPRFDEPHITFFSTSTLPLILGEAGFEPVFCATAGAEYRNISSLRFHLPHWRWFLQDLVPPSLFHWLRKQRFTERIRVPDRVDSFYEYGGRRIWIRSISRKKVNC